MIFTDSELAYLNSQPLGRIATQQPNGTLQVSPVGFAYNPETRTIDITGFRMAESRKYKNVADNGRVAFVVDDLASRSPWHPRCIEMRGRAEAMVAGGVPIIRITVERVISFGIEETNTSAHQFRIDARDVN